MSDDEPRIVQTVFDRMRLGLAIELIGMSAALVVSIPAGIPLPPFVLAINALTLTTAAAMFLLVRRNRIPPRLVHVAATATWLLAPLNTLSAMVATREVGLVFPFIIEMALASIMMLSQPYLRVATASIFAIWLTLDLTIVDDPNVVLHVASVLAVSITTWLVGRSSRRSLDEAILREREQEATAALLQRELEERQRAEHEREALRDQFIHAQRMDAVGTLAAGLAHDMNNIIAAILGVAELAAEETSDPASQADFVTISREASRAAELTRGLLAFSRRGQYRRSVIPLESVIDELEPLVMRMFSGKVTLERRGSVDVHVDADAAQLGQAIVNLCINGADAMEREGQLTLTTGVTRLAGDAAKRLGLAAGEYASVAVHDHGVGIPDDVRQRMFEPFFTTKGGRGTGLGLSMVYGTVHGHGGAIDVESSPTGSTFTLYLPTAVEKIEATRKRTTDATPIPAVRQVALVVDDEPMVRAVATRILRSMGMSVIGASDGAEALEVFAARHAEIDVIILDMSMPVMGGAEVFREIRKQSQVPIVIASGFTSQTETQQLLATGNAVFLEKPFRVETLREQVQRMLAIPRSERAKIA